jgi:hypothetical protein
MWRGLWGLRRPTRIRLEVFREAAEACSVVDGGEGAASRLKISTEEGGWGL